MKSVESEGNTIDEAIDNALRLLRLERDAVEIEILENATKGVLGFGTKKAKVRARERASVDAVLSAATSETSSAKVERQPEPKAAAAPERAPARERAPAPERSQVQERRAPERPSAPRVSQETKEDSRPPRPPLRPASHEVAEDLADILDEIFEYMDVDVEVDVATDPAGEATVLRVTGPDGGIVIGRRGQTLDALEHIMNRIAMRETAAEPTRVRVDVEGYRERRQESLEQLARRLADEARETGRVVTLNPMSPRDRRVIHLALQNDEHVTTWSQGEGQFRRLLIGPRDDRRRGRQRDDS